MYGLLPALFCALVLPSTAQNLPAWAEAPRPPAEARERGPTLERIPIVPDDPDPVPVDGGLALLALAGGAYAARRLGRGL